MRSSLQAWVKCAQVIWRVNKHACHKPSITGLPVFITFSERKDINWVDRALAELNVVEKRALKPRGSVRLKQAKIRSYKVT